MRSFLLFVAISLIALVFRIFFASSNLAKDPHGSAFSSETVCPLAKDGSVGESGEKIGPMPVGKIAKEWGSLGYPVTHPIRTSGQEEISAWFPAGLVWVLKTFQSGLGENGGRSLLNWVEGALNSIQPGLIFLVAKALGWRLRHCLWVSLLAIISPVLLAGFWLLTPATFSSSILLLSLWFLIWGLNQQSSVAFLAAGFLLGFAQWVNWAAFFPALLILAASIFTCRKCPEGWIPATLLVIGFAGLQIPWLWKLSSQNQFLPLGAVEPYAAFYLGTGSSENQKGNLTERILSLSDPDCIGFLSSKDTTELNRAHWFCFAGLSNIAKNPGIWFANRGAAAWHSLVGNQETWSPYSNGSIGIPDNERDATGNKQRRDNILAWWVFGLLTGAFLKVTFAPAWHPGQRILISGLLGIITSAFLFFDGGGFGFRILAEPCLILLCGFPFTKPASPAGSGPISS